MVNYPHEQRGAFLRAFKARSTRLSTARANDTAQTTPKMTADTLLGSLAMSYLQRAICADCADHLAHCCAAAPRCVQIVPIVRHNFGWGDTPFRGDTPQNGGTIRHKRTHTPRHKGQNYTLCRVVRHKRHNRHNT